jgi:hypothetical protein
MQADEQAEDAHTGCWGILLHGNESRCKPGFCVGKGHLKNKFCPLCRERGFRIPTSHVRQVRLGCALINRTTSGFWNEPHPTIGHFRLVNQTNECSGAVLLVSAMPMMGGVEALGLDPVP